MDQIEEAAVFSIRYTSAAINNCNFGIAKKSACVREIKAKQKDMATNIILKRTKRQKNVARSVCKIEKILENEYVQAEIMHMSNIKLKM